MNGTIDIHEFVMFFRTALALLKAAFFRTLEEMTRFQRKTQQRAQARQRLLWKRLYKR